MTAKISAFVIAYNRADILRACLRRVRFVDELIVVDKSSTDHTEAVARAIADRYVRVPWTPVVEDTRAEAQALCSHDWIICLDDDEILSRLCPVVLREASELAADVYRLPIRHHILGRWQPGAYDGDTRATLYRRGAVRYVPTVHAGVVVASGANVAHLYGDGEDGVYIDHLSHPDVATWLDKANRYTSQPNRSPTAPFAGSYVSAVHLLRSIYEAIDQLKRWEEQGLNGHEAFARFCAAVEAEGEPALRKLHIGCGDHPLAGWVNTDLTPCHLSIVWMDATQPFPVVSGTVDRVFSEHMIEHVSRAAGQAMLRECFRVLRPGGRIRISCPDRQFIADLTGGGELPELASRYVDWARQHFGLPDAAAVGRNLETGFGHQFIYDRATLAAALEEAGFARVTWHRIMESHDPELRGLEHESRMPPGFLQLETMTAEAEKP